MLRKTFDPEIGVVSLVALLSCSMSSAQQCKPVRHYKDGYALLSSAYKTTTAETYGICYIDCLEDERCKSINHYTNGTCELNNVTKADNPARFVPYDKSIYADVRDPDYGSSKTLAVPSCKRLLELRPETTSGIYWIRLGNGDTQTPPFQVYCDMTTDGGGWTLVYSYHFTNFANFDQLNNAVTPIPTWPINVNEGTWVPRSTTVPLSETSYSVMDFTLWKEIGTEFLVKPNISHWISCKPGTGDLVNWKQGTLTCKNVKNVAKVCLGYAPTELMIFNNCGPSLSRNGKFSLFFDGRTNLYWPAHDSCGTTGTVPYTANHLTNITTPGGAMYIR